MTSNYKARRERGQCATCTAMSDTFRCAECQAKANKYHREYGREYRFKKSMERERRLDEVNARLEVEIKQLEDNLKREKK